MSNDTTSTSRQAPYVPPLNPATASSVPATALPYFPPPPTAPFEEREHEREQHQQSRDPLESAEEGAS